MVAAARRTGRGEGRSRRPAVMWVLTRGDGGHREMLTTCSREGSAFPVFSSPDEAELFLAFGTRAGEGWAVCRVDPARLAAALTGPYRHVDRITLDPLPEFLEGGVLNRLASMSRAAFAGQMLGVGPRP